MLVACGPGTTGVSYNPQARNQQTNSNATTSGSDMLGAAVNKMAGGNSILSDIISTFGAGLTTNKSTIVGTWKYTKPCVQFESESLLAKAGGSMAASKVEEKLEAIYQIAGIKPGACTFVFNNDNTMQYTMGGRTSQGKYSFDSKSKTITITTNGGMQVVAYVSVAGSNMGLTFDATKLLSLAGSASTMMNSSVSAILGNYKGMKIGFEFSK